MARSGAVVGKLELLDGPYEPPYDNLENQRLYLYFYCFEVMGSTWIFMSVLYKLYENHGFHLYSNAKWTSEFHVFLIFPSNA